MSPEYAIWRPLFAEAMDEVFFTIEFLDDLIESGRARFWPGEKAAIVTEVKEYPGGAKAIEGLLAAGRMDEIVESLIPQAEAFGREIGCTHAVISSRYGWERVMKSRGWELFQTSVRKAL